MENEKSLIALGTLLPVNDNKQGYIDHQGKTALYPYPLIRIWEACRTGLLPVAPKLQIPIKI